MMTPIAILSSGMAGFGAAHRRSETMDSEGSLTPCFSTVRMTTAVAATVAWYRGGGI